MPIRSGEEIMPRMASGAVRASADRWGNAVSCTRTAAVHSAWLLPVGAQWHRRTSISWARLNAD